MIIYIYIKHLKGVIELPLKVDVGKNIRMLREHRGMSQTDLANAIGESKQTVYKYETGIITNIPLSKIEAISNVLRCPPSLLTGWEDKEKLTEREFSESLSEDELLVLELFRKVPKDNQRIVINMIRAALNDQ